jgi:mRNA interferase MazF
MGVYATGQVVFLTFPFSDLSQSKLRPAVLIANAGQADWVACQITSNPYIDPLAIPVDSADFAMGGLKQLSYIRPGKLFTANESLIATYVGSLNPIVLNRVQHAVVSIIQPSLIKAP